MGTHSQSDHLRDKFCNLLKKIHEEGPRKVPHISWFQSIKNDILFNRHIWNSYASWGNDSSLLGLIDALSECRVFACKRDAAHEKGLFSWFVYPPKFWFKRKMAHRLRQFEQKLKHKGQIQLFERITHPANYETAIARSIGNYVIHSRQVREYDFSAIAITSPGAIHGFGRKVFDSMTGKFDIRIWVDARDIYLDKNSRKKRVVKQMLGAAGFNYDNSRTQLDIVDLLKELRKRLDGKRYLIVFNDVKNDDADWYSDLGFNLTEGGTFEDKLSHALPKGSGGAVIVTTLWKNQAIEMVGNSKNVISLDSLLEDLSWFIFERALNEKEITQDELQIVEKLKNYRIENPPALVETLSWNEIEYSEFLQPAQLI